MRDNKNQTIRTPSPEDVVIHGKRKKKKKGCAFNDNIVLRKTAYLFVSLFLKQVVVGRARIDKKQ